MNPECIELRDESKKSSAKVLAGYGFNCYSFRAVNRGYEVEVLWSAPGFETGREQASHNGMPLLFPFPGRIGGAAFEFEGQQYPLESDDGHGNAADGFVHTRPWRVIERSPQHVVGQFQASVDDPSLLNRWPADFRITVRYDLTGNKLHSQIVVENPDQRPLPFGFGAHPYFHVPLGGSGAPGDCVIKVPARGVWEVKDLLPTGRKLPALGTKALCGGLRFSSATFDDIFTTLTCAGGHCESRIEDPASGRKLKLAFDSGFRECAVYNPSHRKAICLGPYTCVPDAMHLSGRGIDSGLRILPPGESWWGNIHIELE